MIERIGQVMKIGTAIFLALSFAALTGLVHPLLAQQEPGKSEMGQTLKKEQANAIFLKAKEDFAKKDLERAEAGLKACLEIQPGYADALFYLAQVDYQKGDLAQSLVHIQKAEAAHAAAAGDPSGMTSERRNRLLEERARKEEELTRLEAILYSATCKTDIGKFKLEQSTDSLRREISGINDALSQPQVSELLPLPADYSYIHGNILFKMHRFQEAEGEYLKAIQADPRHLPAHNNLINLCYTARDFEKALKYVQQAESNGIKLNPKLKEAVTQIAQKDN